MGATDGNTAKKELSPGLYELVKTRELEQAVRESELYPIYTHIEHGEEPEALAILVRDRLTKKLSELPIDAQISLGNSILKLLDSESLPTDEDNIERLDELVKPSVKGAKITAHPRPKTPLGDSALLTNAGGKEPSLGTELKKELVSADRVDLLCAFIKTAGLNIIEKELKELKQRGIRIRVLTTTYIGATEKKALDRLVNEFGAEVKVNYELQSTRLHAKAWLFYRESGFTTAYVGSSNLSKQALVDGKEWNVRLGVQTAPQLLRKFEATFESYWNDKRFENYDPDRDGKKLSESLSKSDNYYQGKPLELSGLEIRPYPFQQGILDKIYDERTLQNRHRNLIVAATGTGKTLIAAFDYRRLCDDNNGIRPRLMFVAHRNEILQQTMRAFREVLADPSFGEIWNGDNKPESYDHLFASVQTVARMDLDNIPPDHFDVIIIDEFHHASASTYLRILQHFHPKEMLGLTATPERADGVNVKDLFDGKYTAEMRLWDALEAELLVPFQYFGINDDTDLSVVEWKAGNYVSSELSNIYDGNEARVRLIVQQLKTKLPDLSMMKALGFCVDVKHANYMASMFNKIGIPSVAVTGATPDVDRIQAQSYLVQGKIKCIFSVDVFNEGLDIPAVNTVLMLRPTQSATIFLQQLGRGLRHHPSKNVLTVLDFIGNQNDNFSFEHKFRAMTGFGRRALETSIENDFPYLPSGCQIVLDKVTQERVLENIRRQIHNGNRWLRRDLLSHIGGRTGDNYPVSDFLNDTGRQLSDVYHYTSWTKLLRETFEGVCQIPPGVSDDLDTQILKRMSMLCHIDDQERIDMYTALLADDCPHYEDMNPRMQTYARMLFFLFFQKGFGFTSYQEGLEAVRKHHDACREAIDILGICKESITEVPQRVGDTALFSHASYQRQEALAALGYANLETPRASHQGGVAWIPDAQTDAFFVELRKSERDFSPSTMYKDFAISRTKFHWESQNSISPETVTGQRYIHHKEHGSKVMIFIRERKQNDIGTAPSVCLGYANYVTHTGEKPMAITWKLERPLSQELFQMASAVTY